MKIHQLRFFQAEYEQNIGMALAMSVVLPRLVDLAMAAKELIDEFPGSHPKLEEILKTMEGLTSDESPHSTADSRRDESPGQRDGGSSEQDGSGQN